MEKKQTPDIKITKKAAEKITEIAKEENKEGQCISLAVFPGGCSGFQYIMDFKDEPEKTDIVMEQEGIMIFVDEDSIELLEGSTIDFVEDEYGSGFKIDNPNEGAGCSTCAGCH